MKKGGEIVLLAIDIGNSNVSLGVFQGDMLRFRGKLSAQTERSADEYAAVIYDLLRMNDVSRSDLTGCILSSVVPGLTGLVEAAVRKLTPAPLLRVGPGVRTGFRIRIDDPSQLGGDLVADTLAGLTEYGAPLIILDAGNCHDSGGSGQQPNLPGRLHPAGNPFQCGTAQVYDSSAAFHCSGGGRGNLSGPQQC